MTYFKIRDLAWKTLIKNEITELPVKVSQIAKNHGCTVRSYDQAKHFLEELNIWDQTSKTDAFTLLYNKKHLIFYNPENPETRIRFSIAHELGHILLKHNMKQLKETKITVINREPSNFDSEEETEANIFASRLLAPACVLYALEAYTPETISYLCNISLKSAEFRAERIKILHSRRKFFTSPLEREVFDQFQNYIAVMGTEYKIYVFMKTLAEQTKETGIKKEFRCPLCGNTAWVSWSTENGHIWARCDHCNIKVME